jgi:uncharacterized membrane protein YeaQ/YmgE (transglycosylase-associated protein family)
MGFLSWILVGLIAGWLTGKIMHGPGKGVLMDIIVGLLGAMAGGFLMRLLGMRSEGGFIYTVLVAILGAVVLTWIFRKATARKA